MKNPCMECPKVGCGVYHDKCPEYQEFRHGREQEYKKRKAVVEQQFEADDAFYRRARYSHRKQSI